MPFKKSLLVLPILFFASLSACRNKPKDLIVGKWKAIDISNAKIDAMADSIKKTIIASAGIEFTNSGKYVTTSTTTPNNGTYVVSEDGKYIVMTNTNGKAEKTNIEELTSDRLILSDKTGTKVVLEPGK